MTAKTRNLLLAFAALGLGASAWSSYVHYALLTRPGYTSFCDINSTVSCTQAYLSQYGSVWGVPVALGGVFFFTFVLLMAGFGARRTAPVRETVPAYIFAVSTLALGFVLYLAWASFFRLNAVCLLCAITYVAVIGVFVVSGGAATSFPMTTLPRRASNDVVTLVKSPLALGIALVFSVGAVTLINAFPRESQTPSGETVRQYPPLTDQQRFDINRWLDVQPVVDLPISADGAKIVVVKFNDYQCPACRDTHVAYKSLLAKYTASGQVKYVVKHYPLEPECNPNVPNIVHRAACEAAAAVVMAENKGTADKIEDWLFANQQTLTPETVRKGAAEVGGISDFDAQYASSLTQIRTDASIGGQLAVKSTPTFFVNGRKIEGSIPPTAFEAIIEHELQRQQ